MPSKCNIYILNHVFDCLDRGISQFAGFKILRSICYARKKKKLKYDNNDHQGGMGCPHDGLEMHNSVCLAHEENGKRYKQ